MGYEPSAGWDYNSIREMPKRGSSSVHTSVRLPEDVHDAIMDLIQGQTRTGYTSFAQFIYTAVMNQLAHQQATTPTIKSSLVLNAMRIKSEANDKMAAESIVNNYEEMLRSADRDNDTEEVARLLVNAQSMLPTMRYKRWREKLEEIIQRYSA